MDESGFDNAARVEYGLPERVRCYGTCRAGATERLTATAGQIEGRTLARFCSQVKEALLPVMPKNSCIVPGNASFHKYSGIERLAAESGHTVIWLPTYSPDLNSIERFWSKVKKIHRRINSIRGWLEGKSVDKAFRICPNLIA